MKPNTDIPSEPVTKSDEVKGRMQRLVSFLNSPAPMWMVRMSRRSIAKAVHKSADRCLLHHDLYDEAAILRGVAHSLTDDIS